MNNLIKRNPLTKLKYRPEIDGLRAIAIISVILYHLKIDFFGHGYFNGGFLGVDIFFVISGYLITSLIFKELVITGSFSFKYFYERRARRILPVLLLVLLFFFPFAWTFLLPDLFLDFSKSTISSIGFSSNLYFWFSGLKYGAQNGLNPFLHTWSLSVEEQFYFIFPIFLFIIYRYFKYFLIYFLIAVFIASLVLAHWGSQNYPAFTFYILPTRIWELLAGSILAYFEIKVGRRSTNQALNRILPSIGFFLILFSILLFNDKTQHPSFLTLPLIIGTCLIIWFSNKDELITRMLSSKLFVGIGLVSFSLYLWHYPFIIFDSLTEFSSDNNYKKFFLCVFIFFISILSYFFIEIPFRKKKYHFKKIFFFLIFSTLIVLAINISVILYKGYKQRLPEILQHSVKEKYSRKIINSNNSLLNSGRKVYLIGDSHIGFISQNLTRSLKSNNYQVKSFVRGGCIYFPGFNQHNIKTLKVNANCNNDYFNKIKKTLSKEIDAIFIFGGRLPVYISNYYFNNQEGGLENNGREFEYRYVSNGKYKNIQESFKNEILELSKKNKIILIYPVPEVGWNPNRKIYLQYLKRKKKFSSNFDLEYITTSYEVFKNRTKSSFALLDSIIGKNIYRVYPHEILCDYLIKNRCSTHDDKYIFYADDDHLSLKGSEMINDLILDTIENIEKKIDINSKIN